ncbi:Pkinase-domain-containing protein [Rhizodiscina lignyota]|uniref:Pkinase-domain-containing protein n=1 Tax=Rhizodiscina lignyota TaxID=1504668 RepID=A0A9P4M643_9PEZI|nr:Pkinase-domain-containing protein [Rhizodiscina lignyota]
MVQPSRSKRPLPRRSARLQENTQLPSPVTHRDSTATEDLKDSQGGTRTPPSQIEPSQNLSPSLSDTQPFSQFVYPPQGLYEVEDEESEGVWGYLVAADRKFGETMVLKRRSACPVPNTKSQKKDGRQKVSKKTYEREEDEYEKEKIKGIASGGYLIGRHPECDRILDLPTISNRHCLLFPENKGGDSVAVLEDLSTNGTFVNNAIVGRNKRRELEDGDEISIVDQARCYFRYPRTRNTSAFAQQYSIQEQLGKGHFASVYLCIEKCTGMRYAVKKFEKRSGDKARSQVDGLQQEIAVLMGVSHPSLLCLKDTFDEDDGVYLVLELAPEGELFNWIVMKQKLTEEETRRVFVQLFQAVKYLHERNIVHRDIKPENILLVDKNLTVKLADFGLAKIIGEESFTTTLCGTPSYVAPEILKTSNHRRYTRAVDVWSLGVVLYICLCGFPPFSDELYTAENPYTLAQQILAGRFDYPSPYWDSVGDPALDLIDRMLTVDVDERITIDECLMHPWLTNSDPSSLVGRSVDSTDGLTGAMSHLDFSRRKAVRERTLLSAINDVKITQVVELGEDMSPVKIFEKNQGKASHQATAAAQMKTGSGKENGGKKGKEQTPAAKRNPEEFVQLGGKGDEPLFGNDQGSNYVSEETALKVETMKRE